MGKTAQNYRYEFISSEEFWPLFSQYRDAIFGDRQTANVHLFYSEDELNKNKELAQRISQRAEICLVAYDGDKIIGWSAGDQSDKSVFYMRNSAVMPEYRRQGVYTALMKRMVDKVTAMGFQEIYSRHSPTNTDVLIAKMKQGFVIGGMEMTDIFGVLVILKYFPKPQRQALYAFRSGDTHGDEESYRALGLTAPVRTKQS